MTVYAVSVSHGEITCVCTSYDSAYEIYLEFNLEPDDGIFELKVDDDTYNKIKHVEEQALLRRKQEAL